VQASLGTGLEGAGNGPAREKMLYAPQSLPPR
jgi:hypothetical protein